VLVGSLPSSASHVHVLIRSLVRGNDNVTYFAVSVHDLGVIGGASFPDYDNTKRVAHQNYADRQKINLLVASACSIHTFLSPAYDILVSIGRLEDQPRGLWNEVERVEATRDGMCMRRPGLVSCRGSSTH